jgi:phosphotransferase system HPr (HPr) family protein
MGPQKLKGTGVEIAEKIIIQGSAGLHLRSAAKLVLVVSHYQCEVNVRSGPRWANAKSIIGLVSLGAAEGAELVFIFQGDDAEEACRDVLDFFRLESGE